MKRKRVFGLALAGLLLAGALGMALPGAKGPASAEKAPSRLTGAPAASLPPPEEDTAAALAEPAKEEPMLIIEIGETRLTAVLENNAAVEALRELLAEGPVTLPAENYGGFEKVCALPQALPRNDADLTARPGDLMLYNGDSLVLFYGENRWGYTRLGRIEGRDAESLARILGGPEREVALRLE